MAPTPDNMAPKTRTPGASIPHDRPPHLRRFSFCAAALALWIGAGGQAVKAQSLVEGIANPPKSLALGAGSVAGIANIRAGQDNAATAIGVESQATGQASTAIGEESKALGANSTATGQGALAEKDNSTANGTASVARGYQSTSIGANSNAEGAQSTAVGASSAASLIGAAAFGANSVASGAYSTAIGVGAYAGASNSVALGAGSTTTGAVAVPVTSGVLGGRTYAYAGGSSVGVVSVGAPGAVRQIQNVAAGRIAADSTDAVNGSQLYASNLALSAAMGQSVVGLGQAVDALTTIVNQLDARQAAAQKEARGGVAAAVALVNAPMPSAPGKTSWAGNVAKFRDQYAMGFSFAHRLNSNAPLAMTAGLAYTPGTGDKAGRIGMAGEF